MTCKKCGYEHVDVHRTGSALITYCQNCGDTTEEKRDPPREKWAPSFRSMMAGKDSKKGSAISKLIPISDKKKR